MDHHCNLTYHRGITMHKLPIGGDIMGGLFTLAIILIVLFGVSLAPWFLLVVGVLGAIMSIFIIYWRREHKVEIDDLSALEESTNKTPKI